MFSSCCYGGRPLFLRSRNRSCTTAGSATDRATFFPSLRAIGALGVGGTKPYTPMSPAQELMNSTLTEALDLTSSACLTTRPIRTRHSRRMKRLYRRLRPATRTFLTGSSAFSFSELARNTDPLDFNSQWSCPIGANDEKLTSQHTQTALLLSDSGSAFRTRKWRREA